MTAMMTTAREKPMEITDVKGNGLDVAKVKSVKMLCISVNPSYGIFLQMVRVFCLWECPVLLAQFLAVLCLAPSSLGRHTQQKTPSNGGGSLIQQKLES
jgi:hypothetical protein